MRILTWLRTSALICSIALYCGPALADLANLLPVSKTSEQSNKGEIKLNSTNNYIRAAKNLSLPLNEAVGLNQNTRALAYAVQPPEKDNALWSISYKLAENTAAAVSLRLVTVNFDEHQRVLGFETLLEHGGLGDVDVSELLWPTKPVYVLVSSNPPSPATLTIKSISQSWSMLEPQGTYTNDVALISKQPISKKTDFNWTAAATGTDLPLWDLKLVSEPGTQYNLQLRSGNQNANAVGAKGESLTLKNIAPSTSKLRLSIKPSGKQFSRVAVLLKQQPAIIAGNERELQPPQTLNYGQAVSGNISHRSGTGVSKPETDSWIINVPASDEETEQKATQIQITANNAAHNLKLSLNQSGRGTALIKKSAYGELNSGPLFLQPGKYTLNISSSTVNTAYRVKLAWSAVLRANNEKEPNNTTKDANVIVSRKVVKGELSDASDEDFFSLDTSADGAAQYWRLIATGGGVKRITLGTKYWVAAHKDDTNPTLSMDYMLLLPGVHTIKLTGEGRYALRAIPLGPPKPGYEVEPNDGKLGPSGRLTLGEIAKGSLDKALIAGHSDTDQFRFAIKQRGKYRITITAPQDEGIRASLLLNNGPWFAPRQTLTAGSIARYATHLLAGEYIIELTNLNAKRALDEYTILVEELAATADVGHEPNDIVGFSTLITQAGVSAASLGPFDQTDCYKLAPSSGASSIELVTEEKLKVRFLDKYSRSKQILAKRDTVNKSLWSIQPHADTLFFCVSGSGRVSSPKAYALKATMGATIPEPKAQAATRKLPQAMQGGLNVAWYGLGARWESTQENVSTKKTAAKIKKLNRVINNISPLAAGVEWDTFKNDAATYRLNLAGDQAIPLAGVVVNTRTDRYARRKTRHFKLLVSQDGVSFSQAMLGQLSFSNDDQYLLFEKPVRAKYIKFLPLDSFQGRSPHYARFQEIKLIASPTYSPAPDKVDLASTLMGGHIIRHDFKPAIKHNADFVNKAIIDAQAASSSSKPRLCQFLRERDEAEWVVGFHHNRAARVTQLNYIPDTTLGNTPQFPSVKVSVSNDSPLGPWREVASWSSEQLASTQTIPMGDAPWIRFVQFIATGVPHKAYRCPEDIVIREAPAESNYRSILGEWSEYGASGPYEAALLPTSNNYSPKGGAASDTAKSIKENVTVASSVKRERNDDWFLYQAKTANSKSNSLLIKVAHPHSFKPLLSVLSETGEPIQIAVEETTKEASNTGTNPTSKARKSALPQGWTETHYSAPTNGSSNYSIHIQEPPRNVVLTWDASGSMGPQLPYIEMASRRWADYLKPDHEFAKVMKFAEKSHPENEWANLPHMLQGALHSISQKPGRSSDAENSLLDANELLAPRYGNHAIVVTTDGEFKHSSLFWDYQKQHCSTIYAAGLGAAAVREDFELQSVYQDNFQNWVSACGGQYKYCDSVTCLEDFYEVAANDIRRPKAYTLTISEVYRSPPEPGSLSVIAGVKAAKETAKALYVILDASGSMLKRLDGKSRIDIAKTTLKKVVRESVGKQNHFGMRTFGLKISECHHQLTLPIGQHSASRIETAIDRIKVVNLAKTPIAASLEAAASDLASYSGEKVIVLLTDGEETCGGDSESVLTSLRAHDINVKMHIVGFALDDKALVEQFKNWATIGGGQYYEAGNQNALQMALHNAVTPRFDVKNSVGDIVFSGYVGDPQHSLPAGNYVVSLPDYPQLESISVTVKTRTENVVEFK